MTSSWDIKLGHFEGPGMIMYGINNSGIGVVSGVNVCTHGVPGINHRGQKRVEVEGPLDHRVEDNGPF